MRKIELHLGDEFKDATADTPVKEVNATIGYLASWACGSSRYATVSIYGDKNGDLNARYFNEHGDLSYTILAILNSESQTYSTHS